MEQTQSHSSVVLVVEDEPLVRMLGADFLESAGFEVIEACNADEALRVLALRDDVRAVFTDVDMPGSLDGLDLAWRIHETWPGIGVVLTSGRCFLEPNLMPRDDVFVPKPYAAPALVRHIETVMARQTASNGRSSR
jgi:two-component system, response regulator PdtaR